jgi:hypothetical protein
MTRITRQPLIRPSTPSYMRTNPVLIQTDCGRRVDATIRYNRIIEDPYQRRNSNVALKACLVIIVAVALFISLVFFPDRLGFSSLPLTVSDKKYFGINSNNNGSISSIDDEGVDFTTPTDDNIDEFRGAGDDDTQDVESDVVHEGRQSIDTGNEFGTRNDTLVEEDFETVLIDYSINDTTANLTNGTLKSIMRDNGRSGDGIIRHSRHSGIREEHNSTSKRSGDENQDYDTRPR